MAEYIDRDAVYTAFTNACTDVLERASEIIYIAGFSYERVIEILDDIPTADVAPVVHGRWKTNSDRPDTLICSVCKCGFDMWKHDPHNFCPNCGARMDEDT